MSERTMNRWRKRGAAVALLTALGAVAVVGPTPAGAAPPPAVPTADFCANVPDEEAFTDLTSNEANINCMAFTEITLGLAGGTTYGPGQTVSRAQMASFIARMIDTANELEIEDVPELPATGANAFTDDNGIAPHEAAINRLAAVDVVNGLGGGLYGPDQPVSRAQMATFINNAQAFLSGNDTRFTSDEDFFVDDELQTAHEANINGLAGAGIVQGGPLGAPQNIYGPELPVNRSQMASFVIRYMALLESLEIIRPAGTPPPPDSNATIVVEPTEAASATNVDGTGNPNAQADDRTYTVSGLTDGQAYRVTLVNTENITETDGVYSFIEDANTGFALATPNQGAAIVSVSGGGAVTDPAAPATPQQSVHVADPGEDGEFSFTVDAVTFGNVTPVVYEAPTAPGHADTRLDLDGAGLPEDAFGLGGAFQTLPAQAPNTPDNGDAVVDPDETFTGTVIGVDKDANIVSLDLTPADPADPWDDVHMIYGDDPDDVFDPGPSITTFEAQLSRGDELTGVYRRGDTAASTFTLTDNGPDQPTLAVNPASTSAVAVVDMLVAGSTARVYLVEDGPGAEVFADATEVASAYVPADGQRRITITGLDPETKYVAFARAELDGELSQPSAGVAFETTAAPSEAIEIQSVSLIDFDTVRVTFTGDVTCDPADLGSSEVVNVDDADDDIAVANCDDGAGGFLNRVDFDLAADMTNNEEYTLELATGAVETLGGDPVVALSSDPFLV